MGADTEPKSADAATAAPAASTAAPPARKEGAQENSEGVGVGGTDDTTEDEEDEEVYPKVSKVKMTPRGGRHEPYEKKEEGGEFSLPLVADVDVVVVAFI